MSGRIGAMFLAAVLAAGAAAETLVAFEVRGDAIDTPLGEAGDAERGRMIATDRVRGGCTLCHAVPGERFAGDIGPPLAGVGARLAQAQLRLRVVDTRRLNPASPMPAYYRADGLVQVAAQYRGKPVLDAQQVEDVVAWLATLRDSPQ